MPSPAARIAPRNPFIELTITESASPSTTYRHIMGSGGIVESNWLDQYSLQGCILTYNAEFKRIVRPGGSYELSFRFPGELPRGASLWACWSEKP